MIAAFPTGAVGLLAIAIAAALWLLFEFTCRKQRSLRTWIVDGVVTALIVVGIALLPVRIHAWIARLSLGFIVGSALLFGLYLTGWRRTIRRFRKATAEAEDVREAERVAVPPPLEQGRDTFLAFGFESVVTVRYKSGSVVVHLIRAEDGIVAEVIAHPPPHDPTPVLEITSLLARRSGVLVTSTNGLSPRLWSGELRQVFPGASVDHLLENHLSALAFLRGRGIEADPLPAAELLEVKEEMLNRAASATLRAPSKALRRELLRGSRGMHTAIGPLTDHTNVGERIAAFYDLRARSGPKD